MQCSANVKTALRLRVSAVFYAKASLQITLAALAHHAAFIQQLAALNVHALFRRGKRTSFFQDRSNRKSIFSKL